MNKNTPVFVCRAGLGTNSLPRTKKRRICLQLGCDTLMSGYNKGLRCSSCEQKIELGQMVKRDKSKTKA